MIFKFFNLNKYLRVFTDLPPHSMQSLQPIPPDPRVTPPPPVINTSSPFLYSCNYLVFKYIRLNQERYSYKETPYFCLQKGCLNSTEFVYIPPRNCSTFLFKKAMGVPNVYSLI